MKIKHLAAAAALVCAAAPALAVGVFNEFTLNETVVAGAPALASSAVVGDKFNGSYEERLTVTGPGTFSARAFAKFAQLLDNDGSGTVANSTLCSNNILGCYRLVAVFSATGNITGPNSFASTNNSFSLYLDPNVDTEATFTDGTTDPTLLFTGDDVLLATAGAAPSSGTGNLNGPPGAFNIDLTDFALTAFGSSFFVEPNPFYMNVRTNGDYDVVTATGDPATRIITGDVSAVFAAVPEPTSLALVGLALAGLGVASRRKAAAKV